MNETIYKVILVDDEILIRNAIEKNIRWSELGFRLTGTYANGKEAIEAIEQDPPHLVLTDICMPFVDGLDLAQYMNENYPESKVVIISGYDEFDYARKALKYHVLEYILKPITASELSGTLQKIKAVLDDEQHKKKYIQKIQETYQRNLPILRQRFLNYLIRGHHAAGNLPEKLKAFDIPFTGPLYNVVYIGCDGCDSFLEEHPDIEEDLVLFGIYNITEEVLRQEENCIVLQDVSGVTTILLSGERERELELRTEGLCQKVQGFLKQYLQIEPLFIIGKTVDGLERLSESYKNTQSAREYRFLFEDDKIIFGKETDNRKQDEAINVSDETGQIVLAVKTGNEEEIEKAVTVLFSKLKEKYIPKSRVNLYIQNLILKVLTALDESGVNEEEGLKLEQKVFEILYKETHMAKLESAVMEFCCSIATCMADTRSSTVKKQAVLALDYIEKNYKDSSVSLQSVCNYLSMSTSYFSSLFKSYTGETFIETLTKKRVEKAKSLIENTALKTYEIAGEVGYADAHYFSSIFKKYTGMSPTEYSKKRGKQ